MVALSDSRIIGGSSGLTESPGLTSTSIDGDVLEVAYIGGRYRFNLSHAIFLRSYLAQPAQQPPDSGRAKLGCVFVLTLAFKRSPGSVYRD